ncbi:MAG: hypothetical protein OXH30_11550, partial [Chloroflexi bacterium]|nr:hypothetical protein [Chloroflexota bacterium]
MTTETGLPPALDALKSTVRQIVRDECIPLELEYLVHPPQEGEPDNGAPRGVLEAVPGVLGSLSADQWGRLNHLSQQTGIYTSFVPEEYGGGGMGALGHLVLEEE